LAFGGSPAQQRYGKRLPNCSGDNVKIGEILRESQIVAELRSRDKAGVLREMATHMCENGGGVPTSDEEVVRALLDRERLGSTGVGDGVAIPHAKIPGLNELVACFGRATRGVPFDSIDEQPVNLIFVLLVPENSAGAHLKALARISRLLKNASFRTTLLGLPDRRSIYDAFLHEDAQY
jgi:PTS system nitrogen regulatory IIA component